MFTDLGPLLLSKASMCHLKSSQLRNCTFPVWTTENVSSQLALRLKVPKRCSENHLFQLEVLTPGPMDFMMSLTGGHQNRQPRCIATVVGQVSFVVSKQQQKTKLPKTKPYVLMQILLYFVPCFSCDLFCSNCFAGEVMGSLLLLVGCQGGELFQDEARSRLHSLICCLF